MKWGLVLVNKDYQKNWLTFVRGFVKICEIKKEKRFYEWLLIRYFLQDGKILTFLIFSVALTILRQIDWYKNHRHRPRHSVSSAPHRNTDTFFSHYDVRWSPYWIFITAISSVALIKQQQIDWHKIVTIGPWDLERLVQTPVRSFNNIASGVRLI